TANMTFAAGDTVTLFDTGANIGALTSGQLGDLGADGIDQIDSSDGVLTISLDDFNALGSVTLTQADTITLADTGATLASLSISDIDALAAGGIDKFDATDNAVSFSVDQLFEIADQTIQLTGGDTVTLFDTGADIAALTTGDIDDLAALGVDGIDASDNVLTL